MKKKVYFFNTHLGGGAANAAINIFNCVNELKKHNVNFFHSKGNPQEKENINPLTHDKYFKVNLGGYQKGFLTRLQSSAKFRYQNYIRPKYLNNRPIEFELFAFASQYYNTPIDSFGQLPDLIHLHWISNWIDYPSFFKSIPNHIPIVWTLHDMNPFTGGCHYSVECKQYKEKGCKKCYQLNGYKNGKIVNTNWKTKFRALKDKNLHIVGNSNWTTEEAKKSILFAHAKSFTTINLSIDTNVFKPLTNLKNILEEYNIPKETFIVLLGAHGVDNPRKGILKFLDAADNSQTPKHIRFVTFGSAKLNQEFKYIKPIHLGKLKRNELPNLYNLADIMVVPSLYEAFGLTATEAMACGTPVIGFNKTGLEDTIVEDKTGWLVNNGDFKVLTKKVNYLSHHFTNSGINAEKIAARINANFCKAKEQSAYNELYSKLI